MAAENRSAGRRSPRWEPLITLLTDFGTQDYYVAAMKGVILRHLPRARLVDISHDIPPQSIPSAAFVLRMACREFPAGTVHLAVVDPGVGSDRRILVARAGRSFFVAPDNGLLTPLQADGACFRAVTHPALDIPPASHTFHGRDLFAPLAARLAAGFPFSQVGPVISDPHPLPIPTPHRGVREITGHVLHVDRFGNLITDIPVSALRGLGTAVQVKAGERTLVRGLQRTYSEVPPGSVLALVGSAELLEIAVRDGNAAASLELGLGDEIIVQA